MPRKPVVDAAGVVRLVEEEYKFEVAASDVAELPSYDDRAFALRGRFSWGGESRAILKVFNDEDSAADGFLEVRREREGDGGGGGGGGHCAVGTGARPLEISAATRQSCSPSRPAPIPDPDRRNPR